MAAPEPTYEELKNRVEKLETELLLCRSAKEERLQRYRDRLINILESISDGFFSLDNDLRVTYFNGAAARLLQRAPEEVLGRKLFDAFPQARGSIFETQYTEALRTRKSLSFETYFGVPPYENWYDVQVYPFEQGITVFFRVITEIKKGREERERLERQLHHVRRLEAIGTLSAGIAHDFNNLLFPIIGYSEMLMDDAPPGSGTRENLQEIFKAANRAKELIRQILAFSRQSGEEEKKPIGIANTVKEVLRLLGATLPSTIEIRKAIDPECGKILASPTQLHQILMNLCTNAYHAMQETGGTLTVSLSPHTIGADDVPPYPEVAPGSYLRLTVTDTGVGMRTEIIERIFEPYFTTRRERGGNGLGLSVVHGIVRNLGGHIGVYSDPGKGTAFHVYLPRFTAAGEENGRTAERGPLQHGTERVLLVDDEPQTADMLRLMLTRLGYEVTSKTDSLAALKTFAERPDDFDLVITDTTMPRMTGITLFRKLVRIRPDIPVILCTGYSDLITEEKAGAMGIKAFISKPVVMREFAAVLREVLDGDLPPPAKEA